MTSFLDLLTQKQPQFQTHQALLVLDLQNDFLRPDGKLPVSSRSGFLPRIKRLVDTFRETAGDVIFVRTIYVEDRNVNTGEEDTENIVLTVEGDSAESDEANDDQSKSNGSRTAGRPFDIFRKISRKGSVEVKLGPVEDDDDDEPENFLRSTAKRQACCVQGTKGAELVDSIRGSVDDASDVRVDKTYYSAFKSTSLLLTLRARLITELYICGCMTNVSVYATAMDAARHGLTINIVEDCLGYRKASRHQEALRQMVDVMGAFTVTSIDLLNELADQEPINAPTGAARSSAPNEEELSSLARNLRLSTTSSLLSSQGDDPRSSIEAPPRELQNGSRPSTSAGQSISEHPLRTKRSTRLQKKMPSSTRETESGSAEQKLNSKRSKIRMRKRDSSPPGGQHAENATVASTFTPATNSTPETSRVSLPEMQQEPSKRPTSKAGMFQNFTRKSMDVTADNDRVNTSGPPDTRTPTVRPRRSGFLSAFRKSANDKPESPAVSASSGSPVGSEQAKAQSSHQQSHSRGESLGLATPSSLHTRDSSRASEVHPMSEKISALAAPSPLASSPLTTPVGSSHEKNDFFASNNSSAVEVGTRLKSARQQSVDSPADAPKREHKPSVSSVTIEKPGTGVGEGDSWLSTNVLPPSYSSAIFHDLFEQVRWQSMYHQTGAVPRLVCVQGATGDDGSQPVYRHPTDYALPLLRFSPSVKLIRDHVEKIVRHPLNHVLIQLYRSGQDYISEHSDKTLDIVRGSSIVNVSFGAQRTMRLRTKKSANDPQSISFDQSRRQTQRIPLPHNSAFVLGSDTNMRWLHGINADKRPQKERSPAEKAYQGMRISLTFRHIGTYLSSDSKLIWGQGATGKSRENARPVINNDARYTEAMVAAFGRENQATELDWRETYGSGFDVLHFRADPNRNGNAPTLFLSGDAIEDAQVKLYLDSARLEYTTVGAPPDVGDGLAGVMSRGLCFRDADPAHTEVGGSAAALLYLDRFHPLPYRVTAASADDTPSETRADIARRFELMTLLAGAAAGVRAGETWLLGAVEPLLTEGGYVAGREFGFVDCALFPVMQRCWDRWDEKVGGELPRVKAYLARMEARVRGLKPAPGAGGPGRKLSSTSLGHAKR